MKLACLDNTITFRGGVVCVISQLDSSSSGPGSSPGLGNCVVFFSKALRPPGAVLHPGPVCSKSA